MKTTITARWRAAGIAASIAALLIDPSSTFADGWTKPGVNGKVEIGVEAKSTAPVDLFIGREKLATLDPGYKAIWNLKNVPLTFSVTGRKHLSSSDVPGGLDAHFEDVWINLRVK